MGEERCYGEWLDADVAFRNADAALADLEAKEVECEFANMRVEDECLYGMAEDYESGQTGFCASVLYDRFETCAAVEEAYREYSDAVDYAFDEFMDTYDCWDDCYHIIW